VELIVAKGATHRNSTLH